MDKLKFVSDMYSDCFEFKNYIFKFDFISENFMQSVQNLHDAIFIAHRCNAKYFAC